MKRHLLVLLVVTLLVRGVMFVSFPLSGTDDDQAGQQYLIGELLQGNLLIGNLRYNTGYAFAIAPVAWFAEPAGAFADRVVLAVQIALSASIPFFIYDMLRRTRSANEGFFVALLVAITPFGLQWAHFYLPEWLVAWLYTIACWLLVLARGWRNRRLQLGVAAGVVMGLAVLARVNSAVIALVVPFILWWPPTGGWKRALGTSVAYAATLILVLLAYVVVIQVPSTGTTALSCITGVNLLDSTEGLGLRLDPANGPASEELARLMSQPVDGNYQFLADTYPNWRIPSSWLAPVEIANHPAPSITWLPADAAAVSRYDLIVSLGPCPADALFRRAYFETVFADPVPYASGTLAKALDVLLQHNAQFGENYLPTSEAAGTWSNSTAGFARVSGGYYTGQVVWLPGVTAYAWWFGLQPLTTLLALPALIYALFSRKLVYVSGGLTLIAVALSLALFMGFPPARLYASVWMLWPTLIGGMLWAGYQFLKRHFVHGTPNDALDAQPHNHDRS